jgi:threonine dehydrogenase-like Zn-dependent dehydrogenase
MRALQLVQPGQPRIIDIKPPSCGPHEIVLRMEATTICNQFDLAVFSGHAHGGGTYPMSPGFPGHEGAGRVVEVGSEVTDLSVGDHVVTSGIGGDPLYRELVRRRHDAVVKIPRHVPWELAAPMELFGCVHRAFSLTDAVRGRRVGVVGLGPAGLAAVALARALEAAEVVGFDLDPDRRRLAQRMGATCSVDPAPLADLTGCVEQMVHATSDPTERRDHHDAAARLQQAACDVIFECTGHPRSLETSFLLAARELTIFGYVDKPVTVNPAVWFHRELVIRSSKQLKMCDLRAVAQMLAEGRIDPRPMITAIMPFTEYAQALDRIRARRAVKIALCWD